MSIWYRVFSRSETEPEPIRLLEHLHQQEIQPESKFRGDKATGWVALEMILEKSASPLQLERWLVHEEGIRQELNSWAAFLETCDYEPNHVKLMERVIQSKQLFTLRRPLDYSDEITLEKLCETLCQWLAQKTDGIYQIDQQGFFDADGTKLLQEY